MEKPFTSLGSKDCQRSDNSVARAPPHSSPSASSVSRVFTRWIPVNIWHVRDAVDTSSSMHMRIVFFFFFFFLSLLFFSHNRTPRCHEKGGGGNFNAIDRSVADTFAPDWFDSRQIFESCWMCGCRSWYRYESGEIISVKRLEDCYRLWDKAL